MSIAENTRQNIARGITVCAIGLLGLVGSSIASEVDRPQQPLATLQSQLKVGDVVFVQVQPLPFRKVSEATNSWVNHVGIVVDTSGSEPVVAESKFPLSTHTPLSKFVGRSADGRVAIRRLNTPISDEQQQAIANESRKRLGKFYDTGFNLNSDRQFCSKFVHQVVLESTGQSIGEKENFQQLLTSNPNAKLGFWKLWFFGQIPWERTTLTPASLYRSPALLTTFDGRVI
jgi:Permuted papain-like amidase enzyme, YaeF/YiiX, C92 family